MASKTEICNMALSHLGVGKVIANIETEQSEEATACRVFYDVALGAILRDFSWPFATKIESLALIDTDPNDEWSYSYRYPSSCVRFRKIQSGSRNDSRQSEVSYKVAKDNSGQIILTDQENAVCEYTEYVSDPAFYPYDFQLTLSSFLASLIAPRLTKGDPFKIRSEMLKIYQVQLNISKASALNEEVIDEQVESEFIRTRGSDEE